MIPDFEIHKNTLLRYRGHERKVIIPEGIEFIAANAFNCCQTVTEVILPETLVSIGDSAFGGCTYLKSIVITPCQFPSAPSTIVPWPTYGKPPKDQGTCF